MTAIGAYLLSPQAAVAAIRRRRIDRDRRALLLIAVATLAAFIAALLIGDYPLAPIDVFHALISPLTGVTDPATNFIVHTVRLPRALTAVVAGAAFGLSGIIFQTLLRNPLASPDLIGISLGSSAAAVAAIILFSLGGLAVSLAAFGGGLATALAIYFLAWRNGVTPYRMVLIGIGLAALLSAAISYMFTHARIEAVKQALAWLVGTLNGATYDQLAPLAIAMLVIAPLTLGLLRVLSNLELGDDTAKSLGTRVELSRLGLILAGVALAAFATAAIGPVSFVAFVAGPIARLLSRQGRIAFLAAPLVGAVVMVVSDLVAQHILPATQLPVGVVTGAFGAIFLIYLLMATNRTGRGG
jgi:iron complex transport system permease protein